MCTPYAEPSVHVRCLKTSAEPRIRIYAVAPVHRVPAGRRGSVSAAVRRTIGHVDAIGSKTSRRRRIGSVPSLALHVNSLHVIRS